MCIHTHIYKMKDCEEVDLGKRGGEVLGGIEEEETFMRIYYVRLEKNLFSIQGKRSFNEKQFTIASL